MKTFSSLLTTAIVLFLLVGCSTNTTKSKIAPLNNTELLQAKALFQTHCKSCHGVAGDHDNRIAPPMIAIKTHYVTDQTTQEEFVSAVTSFVKNPSKEKSKMKGAIRRFNLMLPQVIPDKDVELIAKYVYQSDIEKPEWFDAHVKEEHPNGMGGEHPTQ